jgi:hypothetical protein
MTSPKVDAKAPYADPGAPHSAWVHNCWHVTMWPAPGAGSASPADDTGGVYGMLAPPFMDH